MRGRRDFLDRQRAVGLVRGEDTVVEFEIALFDLQHMRRDRARLGHDLFGREMECRTGHRRRARTAGAFAIENLVGITLNILSLVRIEAEAIANQLLEYGLVALALRI